MAVLPKVCLEHAEQFGCKSEGNSTGCSLAHIAGKKAGKLKTITDGWCKKMSAGGAAGAAGAAAAAGAIVAQAIKASGAIVKVEPEDFRMLLDREEKPLVVVSQTGIFKKHYQYLAGFKGLIFYAKSAEVLRFKSSTQVVQAKKIWIPG